MGFDESTNDPANDSIFKIQASSISKTFMSERVIEPEFVPPTPQPLALSAISGVNVEALLAKAIDAKSAVEVLERLMVMRREARAESAKEAFDRALAEFQRDCPTIAKKKQVFMNGKLRYSYAPLESIIQQVKELLQRHGFSYALDAIVKPGWVLAQCKATHAFGHSQTSSFEVPIDPDAYMNEAQKFASALTFAKRYAFCNAFGILTGDEDDDSGASSEKAQNAPRSAARSAPSTQPVQNAPRGNSGAPVTVPTNPQTPPKPFPTAESLTKAIVALQAAPNMDGRNLVTEYFRKAGAILPTESLEDLPLRFCPNTPGLLRAVGAAIANFEAGEDALLGFPPHPEPEPVKEAPKAKPVEHPDPEIMGMIVTVPRKGTKRADYMKNPDTIGSLYENRHASEEDRRRLFGFSRWEPSGWTKDNGQVMPPSDSDLKFKAAHTAFMEWFKANHADEFRQKEEA